MIGLFLGKKELPIEILKKIKKKIKLFYSKILLKNNKFKKIKIVFLLILENLVKF